MAPFSEAWQLEASALWVSERLRNNWPPDFNRVQPVVAPRGWSLESRPAFCWRVTWTFSFSPPTCYLQTQQAVPDGGTDRRIRQRENGGFGSVIFISQLKMFLLLSGVTHLVHNSLRNSRKVWSYIMSDMSSTLYLHEQCLDVMTNNLLGGGVINKLVFWFTETSTFHIQASEDLICCGWPESLS